MTKTPLWGRCREFLEDPDPKTRRLALASLVREPQATDRGVFEDLLFDSDPTMAHLAFLGLQRVNPPPPAMSEVWRDLFGDSIERLARRATQGPLTLRLAAIQALTFAPGGINLALMERLLQIVQDQTAFHPGPGSTPPSLPLVHPGQSLDLPEGISLLLSSLPINAPTMSFFQRELSARDPERILPVVLSLQLHPFAELTDALLPHVRAAEPRLAMEAARALAACGGGRMFPLFSSLLRETNHPEKKAVFLHLMAQSGRPEVWPVLCHHLAADHPLVRRNALAAAAAFPVTAEEKREAFFPRLEDPDPTVAMPAALHLWHLGSMEALSRIEVLFLHGKVNERDAAGQALGRLPPEIGIPPLLERIPRERSGNVLRTILLALRRLLPALQPRQHQIEQILPLLKRLLGHTDPFLCSQAAVLCGILGQSAEDLILSQLEQAGHPHVLASLLAAIGRIGSHRLLILARFHDHPDPRVRANLMQTLAFSGTQAIPYLTGGLQDPAPRVRASAARSLFLQGQLDVVVELNRMLLIPSPLPILAGCHALGQLMRLQPPTLRPGHPLPLALDRRIQNRKVKSAFAPSLLSSPEVPTLLEKLAIAGGDGRRCLWVLEEQQRRYPGSHVARRLAVSFFTAQESYEQAHRLMEGCLAEHPSILADLLDSYRLALLLGNLDEAREFGTRVRKTYNALHQACLQTVRESRGEGAEALQEKLYHLTTPSMNLYNAMIQLKAGQGDHNTVLELLAELFLARPTAGIIARKLAGIMPEAAGDLKRAMLIYASSLPDGPL